MEAAFGVKELLCRILFWLFLSISNPYQSLNCLTGLRQVSQEWNALFNSPETRAFILDGTPLGNLERAQNRDLLYWKDMSDCFSCPPTVWASHFVDKKILRRMAIDAGHLLSQAGDLETLQWIISNHLICLEFCCPETRKTFRNAFAQRIIRLLHSKKLDDDLPRVTESCRWTSAFSWARSLITRNRHGEIDLGNMEGLFEGLKSCFKSVTYDESKKISNLLFVKFATVEFVEFGWGEASSSLFNHQIKQAFERDSADSLTSLFECLSQIKLNGQSINLLQQFLLFPCAYSLVFGQGELFNFLQRLQVEVWTPVELDSENNSDTSVLFNAICRQPSPMSILESPAVKCMFAEDYLIGFFKFSVGAGYQMIYAAEHALLDKPEQLALLRGWMARLGGPFKLFH